MTIHYTKNGMPMERAVIVLDHTTETHMTDIVAILVEELKHWQDILSDNPSDDQAGRRSAAVFYLLCDLDIPGYEAP